MILILIYCGLSIDSEMLSFREDMNFVFASARTTTEELE
jgi:hypothetical protein